MSSVSSLDHFYVWNIGCPTCLFLKVIFWNLFSNSAPHLSCEIVLAQSPSLNLAYSKPDLSAHQEYICFLSVGLSRKLIRRIHKYRKLVSSNGNFWSFHGLAAGNAFSAWRKDIHGNSNPRALIFYLNVFLSYIEGAQENRYYSLLNLTSSLNIKYRMTAQTTIWLCPNTGLYHYKGSRSQCQWPLLYNLRSSNNSYFFLKTLSWEEVELILSLLK